MNIHIDQNIGVSGSKVFWCHTVTKTGTIYWCRMPIAIFGSFNTDEEYLKKVSPFDPQYQDNFVEGKGSSKEEAEAIMNNNLKEIADSLWAI